MSYIISYIPVNSVICLPDEKEKLSDWFVSTMDLFEAVSRICPTKKADADTKNERSEKIGIQDKEGWFEKFNTHLSYWMQEKQRKTVINLLDWINLKLVMKHKNKERCQRSNSYCEQQKLRWGMVSYALKTQDTYRENIKSIYVANIYL